MAEHSSRMLQHLADLKMLAELLGGIADQLPRRAGNVGIPDKQALATMDVALPRLTETCNALFDALSKQSAGAIDQRVERREAASARRRMSS
jgi:hypothetical protein